jgi:hypothetical protein
MKTTRSTKIRLEKHEIKLVRFGQETMLFCQNCQTETIHLPIAEIAKMLAVSEKAVFRLAESEKLHSTETRKGQLFICAASAANFA